MSDETTFEDAVMNASIEELEQAYANNSTVDWYKCNVILTEIRRRERIGARTAQ